MGNTQAIGSRFIFFSVNDYKEVEEKIYESGRARHLFIAGRSVVDVDPRCVDGRDMRLFVGRYTKKNLPHYEGLLKRIEKVASDYEQIIQRS